MPPVIARARPLKELVAEVERAIVAVDSAQALMDRVLEESKARKAQAQNTRTAALRRAEAALKRAQGEFDAVVASAEAEFQSVQERETLAVQEARSKLATTTATAEPLTRELHERSGGTRR